MGPPLDIDWNQPVADGRVHARIGLGSCSDRPRIGNDVSAVFGKFLPDVGWPFCVAGAVFGEFGG